MRGHSNWRDSHELLARIPLMATCVAGNVTLVSLGLKLFDVAVVSTLGAAVFTSFAIYLINKRSTTLNHQTVAYKSLSRCKARGVY
jgi:hypothetical protein